MAVAANGALRNFRGRRGTPWRDRGIIVGYAVLALGLFFIVNWIYQVYRKPAEILAPVSDAFVKNPEATWRSYGKLFEKYSTWKRQSSWLQAKPWTKRSGGAPCPAWMKCIALSRLRPAACARRRASAAAAAAPGRSG